MSARCEVVIASYLEPELVRRIATEQPRARVTFEPALLPVPRYPCDHSGTAPTLSEEQLDRWHAITADAEVMFDFDWHEPATMPERCPQLRWIQATSAGVGGFMSRTGLDRGAIQVTTAAGTHAIPLAEFAVMGALHFIKGVPQLNAWKAEHRWERYATQRLAGRRALVIGLGGIGRRTAESLAALGVEVWGMARRAPGELVPGVARTIGLPELDDALGATDVLVIACPLTEQTHHLIDGARLARLPGDAVVVNVGRGPVIEEPALVTALTEGRIAGACLDVFEHEPLPPDSPLWDLDNVIISPHSASTLVQENEILVELFIDNLARYLDGRPLRNVFDAEAGY